MLRFVIRLGLGPLVHLSWRSCIGLLFVIRPVEYIPLCCLCSRKTFRDHFVYCLSSHPSVCHTLEIVICRGHMFLEHLCFKPGVHAVICYILQNHMILLFHCVHVATNTFVSLCTRCNNHIILTFLLFKYTKITCNTKWNRTVLYFKNVACNLKYVPCNTKSTGVHGATCFI